MQEHEIRVVNEHKELGDKLSKLTDFIGTAPYKQLAEFDRVLLLVQQEQMAAYRNTLRRRIGRFVRQ